MRVFIAAGPTWGRQSRSRLLGGKTLKVDSPDSFAKAIAEILRVMVHTK